MTTRSTILAVLAFLLPAALLACGDDGRSAGEDAGEEVVDGGHPDASEPACSDGDIGCVCLEGECRTGECVGGSCLDCDRGAQACTCRDNGACDADLHCVEGLCESCPVGEAGCACDGETCGDGLACQSGICAPSGCASGAEGCACHDDLMDRCDGSLYCDDNRVCRTCSADVEGCPCAEGACTGGVVCEKDTCRAAVTCEMLRDDGSCESHLECSEVNGQDAVCDEGTCVSGYEWDDDAGVCDPCDTQDCSPPSVALPSCDPSSESSIAATCAAALQTCVDDGASAYCGDCLPGTSASGGKCEPVIDCAGSLCGLDEYCAGDSCEPLPCALGEARNAVTDQCEACSIACSGTGLTGRVWPFQNNEDECICETASGYYMPTDSNIVPEVCDADGDGWVRREAATDQVLADPAHRLNARCNILEADGVVLWDEYGIGMEVGSCAPGEGLVLDPDGAGSGSCTGRIPMRLLETSRNDVPGKPTGSAAPVYDHLAGVGAGGRELQARELTSLTKACVTSLADYNDNGQNDLTEQQARPVASNDDQTRLASFSYFTELYRAFYEGGKLHIAARVRCDTTDFFLAYDAAVDAGGYDTADTSTYWRSCARRRDAAYSEMKPGFDFGQWTCSGTDGSCGVAPPAHPTLSAPAFDHNDRLLRQHGLCELAGAPPADGIWRGMSHHSQFKCVQVDDNAGVLPPKYNASAFEGSGRSMVLNVCEAVGDPVPVHTGATSYAPALSCTPQLVTNLDANISVGWAAVGFQEYGDVDPNDGDGYKPVGATSYSSGCISEDAEWGSQWLCSFPSFALNITDRSTSFGRYSCGDNPAFLWANTAGDNYSQDSTLWWDGSNAQGTVSVFR